jgi:hypothetical protein
MTTSDNVARQQAMLSITLTVGNNENLIRKKIVDRYLLGEIFPDRDSAANLHPPAASASRAAETH